MINNQQSTINNQQSSIVNHQSSINNRQSAILNHPSSINNQKSAISNRQSSFSSCFRFPAPKVGEGSGQNRPKHEKTCHFFRGLYSLGARIPFCRGEGGV